VFQKICSQNILERTIRKSFLKGVKQYSSKKEGLRKNDSVNLK